MQEELIFRELEERDVDLVVQLLRRNYDEIVAKQIDPIISEYLRDTIATEKYIRRYLERRETRRLFVLEEDDEIVGTVAIRYPKNDQDERFENMAEMRNLAAYPIRQGYGRKLVEDVENYAKKQNFWGIFLGANPGAKDFYERMEYRTVEERKVDYKTDPATSLIIPIMVKEFI